MVHAVVVWCTLIFMVKFSKLSKYFISYIFLPVDKLEPFFVLSDVHIYSIVSLPHIDILILAEYRIFVP